ncbi:hypothetical protein GCM10008949_46900 [Deinococcus humi]|nr:hypothetical protein GCM10008949_46900 [Deinococcus humi]
MLLFKGFALAEFEYATPGERFYGDVDVLLPNDPAQLTRAVHIALAHGWRSDGFHALPGQWTHESGRLMGQHTRIDLHRFALAWFGGPHHRRPQDQVRSITQQVWARALRVDWSGIPIWRPHPEDAVVVNVALARQWGNDVGHLKAADYPDTRLLMSKYGLTWDALAARAQSLGGPNTWAAFRSVCDPERHSFAWNSPTLWRLKTAAQRDGHHTLRARWFTWWFPWSVAWRPRLRKLTRLPGLLPDVLAAWQAVRAGGDPREHLDRWTPIPPGRTVSAAAVMDIVAGVRVLTKLFYPRQSLRGTCVPRAYATYRALRRRGFPAVFISGVHRDEQGIQGHAWIEELHAPLKNYGEPLNHLRFKEMLRYPEVQDPPRVG